MSRIFLLLLSLAFVMPGIGQKSPDSTAIPVRLKTFSAINFSNNITLTWAVACNIDFALFEVEKSEDGINFSSFSKFTANKLRCLQPFELQDKEAYGKVFYRIVVGDIDGNRKMDKTVSVIGKEIIENRIVVKSPIHGNSCNINIESKEAGSGDYQISNISGQVIKQGKLGIRKGFNKFSIPINIGKGSYIFSLRSKTSNQSVSFIIL